MELQREPLLLDQPTSQVTVIIPVFNEERTIEILIERVLATPTIKQIIVIDDASTDQTPNLLRRWNGRDDITVLRHSRNLGKGTAIRSGLALAKGELLIVQDADLEYNPLDISKLIIPIRLGYADIVLGSRYLRGKPKGVGLGFAVGVSTLNLAVRLLYGCKLTDEATCYKIGRTDTFRKMNLECERFEFCPEVIAKACKMRLRIIEMPVSYDPRGKAEGKKLRLRDGWSALYTLWRWRHWLPSCKIL
jgi:dolichol-phosphate mannosyltransferase